MPPPLDLSTARHIPVSNLRQCTAKHLTEMIRPEVVTQHGDPVAVLVPYRLWDAIRQAAAALAPKEG